MPSIGSFRMCAVLCLAIAMASIGNGHAEADPALSYMSRGKGATSTIIEMLMRLSAFGVSCDLGVEQSQGCNTCTQFTESSSRLPAVDIV